MVIKIRIPSIRGDDRQELELIEAQEYITKKKEVGYTAFVDGYPITIVEELKDGSEVIMLPQISGGYSVS